MFAAIEIGSYALEMKIYEISAKGAIREIDRVFHVIELGRDSYNYKKISFEIIDEVCDILYDFKNIMQSYAIEDYRVCATSAVREAANCQSILDRIRIRTGMNVDVLSNSELRYIFNKAVAFREKKFSEIVSEGTVLVDVGSGSLQMTIYDQGKLITTQNLKLGSLRVRETFSKLNICASQYMDTLEEYVDIDLNSAIDMFFRNVKIKNMIATGDYVSYMFAEADMDIKHKEFITAEDYRKQYDRIVKKAMSDSKEYIGGTKIPTEILIPSAVIYKKVLDITGADRIWLPKVKLCDGMVVEYARKSRKLKLTRNFLEDIISAAWVIAKRYEGDTAHLESVEKSALMVFDAMKKYHGLSERERLLLQIAAIVHDCGKYISILEPGQSCYNIIAGTEIIGLSHKERMMVANIARFNTDDFEYEDVLLQEMDRESYMIILKLTAILRICNALDRTHKQKFGNLNISLNKKELIISTETFSNIAIEKGTFEGKAELFEEIYGIKPVLKVKRGEL
jgi:exopolyphosphatase/guanosine-5'-triphosphate,3'-diphosphate pyrophosphatase